MDNTINKRQKLNSFAFVFLIFTYSLTTIFSLVADQRMVIIITSLVVIGPILLYNVKHLRICVILALLFELIILSILFVQKAIYSLNSDTIDEIILQLLGLGTISIMVGTLDVDSYYLEKNFSVLSIVCFFTSLIYLILIKGDFMLSMRFGYAMLPSSIWFLCLYIKNRKIGWLFLFFLTTLLLIVYGSRGTLICIALLLVLTAIKYRWWWVLFLSLLFVIFSGIFFQLLELGLNWLANVSGSRKILGLLAMFQGDIMDASSGRDILYDRCIQLFNDNPFGNGVGFWQNDPFMGGLYPHNIFLEIAVEFGVIGIFVLAIILILIIVRLFRLERSSFFPYAALISICFGRLMVSSVYWSRPEFWLVLSVFLFRLPRQRNFANISNPY